MPTDQFLHGIEFIGIDTGARTITTPRAGVIGIVGTAPDADASKFPLNTPILIPAQQSALQGLGDNGTLAYSMRMLFAIGSFFIVMVRVEEGDDDNETIANIVGGMNDETGKYYGAKVFLDAETQTKVKPRILIAPGYTKHQAVCASLLDVADILRAIVYGDAPSDDGANYADAITYREQFGNKRFFPVYPDIRVFDEVEKDYMNRPQSIVWAAVEADTDYWKSSSNATVDSVAGLSKSVSFEINNPNTIANLLNEKGVGTVVHQLGYRLWGNRGATDDVLWVFRAHVRLDDMIAEAVIHAHLWAVDKLIDSDYADSITESMNNYLRYLSGPAVGAIAGANCWIDPEINTPDLMDAGKFYVDFDYGRFGIAEHLTFRRFLNNGYVQEIFK